MNTMFQGRLFPKEAAEAIGIAPTTLRKYSQIIEDVTEDNNYFERTDQNVRTYNQRNLDLFKEIIRRSEETKKPLKTIVESMLDDETCEELFKKEAPHLPSVDGLTFSQEELLAIIEQQNKKIDQLLQVMSAFTLDMRKQFNEVKPLIEQSKSLIDDNQQQALAYNTQLNDNIEAIKKEANSLREQQEKQFLAQKEEQEKLFAAQKEEQEKLFAAQKEEKAKLEALAHEKHEAALKVEVQRLEQMHAEEIQRLKERQKELSVQFENDRKAWQEKQEKEAKQWQEEKEKVTAQYKEKERAWQEREKELTNQLSAQEKEKKALGSSPFEEKTKQEVPKEEPKVEKKIGFFQRLFGKK